jgi:sirohydrochlorin ferrochelatase
MSKGTLLLAHGSQRKETEQTMETICNYVSESLGEEVLYAFLQFSDNSLDVGLDALVDKGITDIRIVPYFLFAGVHINEDIPGEIDEYLEKHPGVTVKFGKTLGTDRRLADILVDRIKELG